MNWHRILLASTLPLAGVAPVVALFWWRRRVMLGTVVGTGVLLVVSLFFSAAEFVDADRVRIDCITNGLKDACLAIAHGPADVVRVGAYGLVAFVQVAVLFLVGLSAERRIEDADRDPAWRR